MQPLHNIHRSNMSNIHTINPYFSNRYATHYKSNVYVAAPFKFDTHFIVTDICVYYWNLHTADYFRKLSVRPYQPTIKFDGSISEGAK